MASCEITPRLFYFLTAGRLLVLIIMLLSAFLMEGMGHAVSGRGLEGFFILLAFAFFITIIAILWFKRRGPTLPFIYSYIITDLILVTGTVYLTGGLKSHLSFLYMLVIFSSCFFEYELGPSISAGFATLACIVLSLYAARQGIPLKTLSFSFFTNMAAFWLTALLGSILARKLLSSRMEVGRLKAIQNTVLESLSSGLILTDTSGKVIFVNRSAREALRGALDISPGDMLHIMWPDAWKMRKKMDTEKRMMRLETVVQLESGGERALGLSCFCIKEDDAAECMGYGFIFQDITELKEQERRLQRMDRLAALGEMAAGLAHELRNPLASMSGAAQFLVKKGCMDSSSKRLLEIIEREATRLNSIAESFLMYARPERSTNQVDADPVAVIEDVLSLIQRKKDLPGANIETEFKAARRLSVPEGPLKQVVLNLVLNAFEALGEEGGRIAIALKDSEKEGYTELIIEDSGHGIDEAIIHRIFDPFYSTKSTGTGLGLAIVHSLVHSWGGEVAVHSTKGKGTTFIVTLPCVKESEDGAG